MTILLIICAIALAARNHRDASHVRAPNETKHEQPAHHIRDRIKAIPLRNISKDMVLFLEGFGLGFEVIQSFGTNSTGSLTLATLPRVSMKLASFLKHTARHSIC